MQVFLSHLFPPNCEFQWHRVFSAFVERIASKNSPHRQKEALPDPKAFQGLYCICRASWSESTRRWLQWRNVFLIETDRLYQNDAFIFHRDSPLKEHLLSLFLAGSRSLLSTIQAILKKLQNVNDRIQISALFSARSVYRYFSQSPFF